MQIPLAKIARAFIARVLFAIHGLVVIWRVSYTYNDKIYWLFTVFLIALFVEGGLVIYQRQGNETTWFCISVFLYLCSVVPPLWFLQLELCRKSLLTVLETNATVLECDNAVFEISKDYKFAVCIPLDQEIWVQLMQQTMLVILILGRWILPKGDISRDHLSQILLVFLGMAADMVELFDTFKEKTVKSNYRLTEIVLTVWSVSLIQFPLVLTGRSSKKSRFGYMRHYFHENVDDGGHDHHHSRHVCKRSQVRNSYLYQINESAPCKFFLYLLTNDINFWGVITGILLQDAPFLVTRLYLLIMHQALSYTMIFFTCKNILVVLLQSYRLCVICMETYSKVREVVDTLGATKLRNGSVAGASMEHDGKSLSAPTLHINMANPNIRKSSVVSDILIPSVRFRESRDTVDSTISLVEKRSMKYSSSGSNMLEDYDSYDIDKISD